LSSILSHPEIEKGNITFKRCKKTDLLTFNMESTTLIVSDVDLDVAASDLAKVHQLLAINGDALRPGEGYDYHREASSLVVLDLLARSQGRREGVSRTIHLDYRRKTAQVAFKIWEGPPAEPEPLVPPYAARCPIMNANFRWVDADDFTPVDFIRRQMKIKWLGCFSEGDLDEDRTTLKRMAFLKDAKISVSGSGDSRDFTFYYRSNPISISKVTVHGYGLLAGLSERNIASMPIHVGDQYSRALARQLENSLKRSYLKDGWQLQAFTDVEVDLKGKATLDFSLLAYPDNLVYIGEKRLDVTNHDDDLASSESVPR
jgi:hypothetical protein